ncbi:2-succinylbenzoate--CoA ligase [Rhynchospora pubera]|uniref:4-coumarate--CoA ligase n=1 Tax=Rhynchospora pubera TaxID=906938 RepID=A0AAV8E2H2_9POAL|nr:2-succinylbenzoate--CoA ligase [Rhynchospora pubera]
MEQEEDYARAHVVHCLRRNMVMRRDSEAVAEVGRSSRTGFELVKGIHELAAGLLEAGVCRNDVVAIAALNSYHYIELFLAATYIGAIVAPLNHRWSFEEARVAIDLVQPKLLAVDTNLVSWAQEIKDKKILPSLDLFLLLDDPLLSLKSNFPFLSIEEIKKSKRYSYLGEPVAGARGIALICFTSGTTGKPKGVAISHTSLITQSLAKIAIVGYAETDVYLNTAPLCHIGGISSFLAVLMAGGCNVLTPKFDANLAFQAIQEFKVTSFITVPAIMSDLVSYARKENKIGSSKSVEKILNGGGSLSEDLIKEATVLFPDATIFSAYGMTEACSSLTFMTLSSPKMKESENPQHKSLTKSEYLQMGMLVGKPAPHIEIRIGTCNSNSNNIPSIGRILTRGLHVMAGYWSGNKKICPGSIEKGWFDTGDIGWIDQNGGLWLMGREKDRIKSGGENVYPEEVEAVLSQHPAVAKVLVVGIPDTRLSEKVVACLIIKDKWKWVNANPNSSLLPDEVSAEKLRDYCIKRNLTRFKIPKEFLIWNRPFPVTSTGKIIRDVVKRELMAPLQSNL